jgi:hypothetical protein
MRSLAVALLAAAGACAHGGGGSTLGTRAVARRPRVVTSAELRATGHRNVYESLQYLHPEWLRPANDTLKGYALEAKVGVFDAGDRVDLGLDYLRRLQPADVVRLTYLDRTESESAFGPEYRWGAIVITRP